VTAILAYIGCGILAGLFGGYLGLGGGIVIVPFLTLAMGLDIKEAVPVSMAAIVVNSLAASSEYMKKGMVDIEIMVPLALSMVLGMVIGSSALYFIPQNFIRLLLAAVLLYTALSFLRGQEKSSSAAEQNKKTRLVLCCLLAFGGGVLGSLVGVGGGIILIPLMFLVIGLPLSTSRGTSSFIVGFSGAASLGVYFLSGLLNFAVVPGVMLGTVIGGKLGGKLGTLAKPKAVKIVFFLVILWTAYKLGWPVLKELR
jgi:uncharacterized membrane protein YfcA